MYAKLKSNGQIQVAPKVLRITIANPTDEQLEFAGYKKVIEVDPPEYDEKNQKLECYYEEIAGEIWQMWKVTTLPTDEVVEALEEYINEKEI